MTRCIAPTCTRSATVGDTFCAPHAAAPPGRRGGWLSAHRRALARAEAPVPVTATLVGAGEVVTSAIPRALDASKVVTRLWMGGEPPFDRELQSFGMLVLCAREIQPAQVGFAGRLVRCPLRDADLTRMELGQALAASRRVAEFLRDGGTALVTCAAGRNRSGLVTGLALLRTTRMPSGEVVEKIRAARGPTALSNPRFVDALEMYAGSPARR